MDGHSLFDYDVGLNEIIQLMVRKLPAVTAALGTIPNGVKDKEADGGLSSGDESCSSNKENVEPKVCCGVITDIGLPAYRPAM